MTGSSHMRSAGWALVMVAIAAGLVLASCEVGGPQPPRVVSGPAVPSPIPTRAPYVWDTRSELEIWTNNRVSRGSFILEGDGPDALIRVNIVTSDWVLRGPDLEPPAAVRTVRVRYRWTPDPGLFPSASRTGLLIAYFERSLLAPDQPAAHVQVSPTSGWTEVDLVPGSYAGALEIRYLYFRSFGWNRGVFEIDSIQLVQ